jgi:hypothetical protein
MTTMAKDDKDKPEAKGTNVQKQAGGALEVYDYGKDAGAGFENIKGSDLSIPFIMVLQSNSPQVENNNPEGAKSGMLFNSVTKEMTDGRKGIPFLPCYLEDMYVEWTPRDAGGGLVERHNPLSDIVKKAIASADKKFGKLRLANGNDLVQTSYMYGLTLNVEGDDAEAFAVISCSGTKMKPFRAWTTNMWTLKGKPPLFAQPCIVRTVDDQNKKGKYKNFEFNPLKESFRASLLPPNNSLLISGRDFAEMVKTGKAKAAFETLKPEEEAEVDTDRDPDGDGKAPF